MTVTQSAIWVDGENVATWERKPPSPSPPGSPDLLIEPLLRLLRAAEIPHADSSDASRHFTVIADQFASYRIVASMLYTAGQAGIHDISIGVRDRGSDTLEVLRPTMPDAGHVEEGLNLSVGLGRDGIRIAANGSVLEAVDGCPEAGPTVCVVQGDVGKAFDAAVRHALAGDGQAAEAQLERALDLYRWYEVYNIIGALKDEYPREVVVHIGARLDGVPWAAVVRAIDAVHSRRVGGTFGSNEAFWNAPSSGELFPQYIFTLIL